VYTTTTTLLGAVAVTTGVHAGTTLMDQVGANDGTDIGTNILASQYFEAAYSVYNIAAIDDFDNSGGLAATSVAAVISGWNGYTSIDLVSGVEVNFYLSIEDAAANLTGYATGSGDVTLDSVWTGQAYGDLVRLDGMWALTADTQMVTMIPSNEFANNGQTGICSSFIGDGAAWQANPGGGFGMPNNWQAATENLAFRVMGGVGDPCDLPLGSCPADVTGDGLVDVNDVLGIIGSFGESGDGTFRPLGDCWPSPAGDCSVTVDDLLTGIGAFGADCQEYGACCFGIAGCDENVLEADCTGDWLGWNSTCAECQYGACCSTDGSCMEGTPEECADAGGTYSGDGIDCAAANCPQPSAGACCIGFTDCLDGLLPADCEAFGGTFQGNDTVCTDGLCGWGGCPDGATDEGVPCNEDTTDPNGDPNGGGNSNPPAYGSIADGETICGFASVYTCIGCGDSGEDLTYRDTDWYLFDNSAGGDWTVSGGGELSLIMGVVDNDALAFVDYFITEAYQEGEVTVTLPAGGSYSVFVAPADWDQPTCSVGDNDYAVTLSGSAAANAACCVGTQCAGDMSPADCAAIGGTYVSGESCASYTCPAQYEGCTGSNVNESDYGCVCFVDGDDSETDCNGGSNMASPAFTPLSSGDVICGDLSVYIEGPTGGTYRDLDWWVSDAVNSGGTFDFSIGSEMSTVILLVNLDAGTVDNDVLAAPGTIAEVTWTIGAGNWSVVTAPSEWNTAWTCASGLSEYRFSMD
jgi:hypothetical protein